MGTNLFSRLSLKAKLIVLCLALSSVTLAVGTSAYLSLQKVGQEYGHIAQVVLPNVRYGDEMFLAYRRVRITLRTLGLPGISSADAEQAIKDTNEAMAHFEEAAKRYQDTEYAPGKPFGPGEEELFKKVMAAWTDFKAVGAHVFALYRSGTQQDHDKMVQIFFKDCPEKARVFTAAINELTNYQHKEAEQWSTEAQTTANQANRLQLIIIVAGIFLGLSFGYAIATTVAKNVNSVSAELAREANSVAQSASHIADASKQLATGANDQAAALQETTAAAEQTSAMISKNAENAAQSAQVSSTSQSAAIKGKQVVSEMIQSIEAISASNTKIMQQVEESNREISDIVKVISEIENKTKVINDIVFQTKLLSFNASVEAARAGEHGKGFAVVAEEVGKLAQMSGNAAQEISQMLESSVKKVDQIISNTKSRVERLIVEGREKVQTGSATAHRCGNVLDEIVQNASHVSGMVGEISTATQEQAQGMQEIAKAMSQLDKITLSNASTSTQASQSASNLQAQVLSLREMVNRLNQTVNGAAPDATLPHDGHEEQFKAA